MSDERKSNLQMANLHLLQAISRLEDAAVETNEAELTEHVTDISDKLTLDAQRIMEMAFIWEVIGR